MSRPPDKFRWTRWRRTVQLFIAAFYLVLPLANARGFHVLAGTLAGLKLGPIDLIEPAGAVSAMLAGRQATRALLLGIAPVVLLALALGPVFCSWVCPWGLISEGVASLRSRRHATGPQWISSGRMQALWLVLWLAISAALAAPFIALISPPRLITTLPLELIFLRVLSPVTGGLLLALLAIEVAAPSRLVCRALCPVGVLQRVLRWRRTAQIHFSPQRCTCFTAAVCALECAWNIDPRNLRAAAQCTNCMRCVEVCPSGALTISPDSGKRSTAEL